MTDNRCSTVYASLNDQIANHSPEASKNLSREEHAIAEKLAADVRTGLNASSKDIIQLLSSRHAALTDANKLVKGVQDKSRLDGILADANKLLSNDDYKLLQTVRGVVIGRREQNGKDWSIVPLRTVDCE
jgi:hypothetical protein